MHRVGEEEGDCSSIHWFTSKMSGIVRTGTPSGHPTGVAGSQAFEPSPSAFPGTSVGSEEVQLRLKSAL